MSFAYHNTRKLMWEYETTEGVDPGSASPYYFGKRTQSFGDLPRKDYKMYSYYRGSRNPFIRVSGAESRASIAFAPVNGVPFYWWAGSSLTTSGEHYVSSYDRVDLPTITTRFQTESANESIRKSMVGAKAKNINFTVNNDPAGIKIPAVMGVGLQAIDIVDPTDTGDLTPQWADGEENMYFVDDNTELIWDAIGAGDQIDYTDDMLSFKFIGDSTNRFSPLMNKINPDTVLEGNKTGVFMIELLRGGDTSIYDDYISQEDIGNANSNYRLEFKIHNTDSQYIKFSAENCMIESIKMNDGNERKGEHQTYVATILASDPDVYVKDGLDASTFYGE